MTFTPLRRIVSPIGTRFVSVVLIFALCVPVFSAADPMAPFSARVVSVTSANSLIVVPEGREQTQVVLAFLSIPISDQPYSGRAKSILKAQLLNRRITVRPIGEPKDKYVLGLVYVGQDNFNLDFLARGHAWVDYYEMSHPAWMAAQQEARTAKRGLYSDPQSLHPLDWKAEMKKANVIVGMTETMSSDPEFEGMFKTTYVGNRKEKIFIPASCLKRWAQWPRATLVAFTTPAGAEDNGYKFEECD